MTMLEHAKEADRLLTMLAEAEHEMVERSKDPEKKLSDIASGAVRVWNERAEWLVKVAQAHALTAIALKGVK